MKRRRSIDLTYLTAARSLAKVAAFPALGARRTESGKHGRESISHKIQHLGISHSRICASPREARGSILLIRESISVYLRGAGGKRERELLSSYSRREGYWPVMRSIDIRFPEHLKICIFLRDSKVTAYPRMEETQMAMSIQRRRHARISSDRIKDRMEIYP